MKFKMNLLVIDLDGTITKSDNLIEFSIYMILVERQIRFILALPLLILLKLSLISNDKFKIYYSILIFRNLKIDFLKDCARKFVYSESFLRHLNPDVLNYINSQKDTHKVILSANYDFIAECVAQYLKIESCISINLETKDGQFSGVIVGSIPYGKNKIKSFSDFMIDKKYEKTVGLADSKSDFPLLQYLDEGYQIKHNKRTNRTAFIRI